MNFRNLVITSLLIMFSFLAFTASAEAQVAIVRGAHENPVVSIAKSTLYGGATGVLLGLALTLVVDEDKGDILKWSFVGGTFGGFLYGIYHVSTRPQPTAAILQFDTSGLAKIAVPQPQIQFNRERFSRQKFLNLRVNLVSLSL